MFEACTVGVSVPGRCGCAGAVCSDGCRCNQCGATGDTVVNCTSREDGGVTLAQQDSFIFGAHSRLNEEDPGLGALGIYAPAVVLSREEREDADGDLHPAAAGSAAQQFERWLTATLELEDELDERRKAMARPEGGRGPVLLGGGGGNYAAHVLETRPSRQQYTAEYGLPKCPNRSFKVRACDALGELEDSLHEAIYRSHKEILFASENALDTARSAVDTAMDFGMGLPDQPARRSP